MSVFDAQSIHTCYIVSRMKIIMLSIIQTLLVSDVTLDTDTLVCVRWHASVTDDNDTDTHTYKFIPESFS